MALKNNSRGSISRSRDLGVTLFEFAVCSTGFTHIIFGKCEKLFGLGAFARLIYILRLSVFIYCFLRLQAQFVAPRIFKDWYYKEWVRNRAVHLWVFGSGLTPVPIWTAGTLELRFCAITRAVRLDRSANGSSIHRTDPVHSSRALLSRPAAGEMRQTDSEHCWSALYLHTWRLTCWAVRAGAIGYY